MIGRKQEQPRKSPQLKQNFFSGLFDHFFLEMLRAIAVLCVLSLAAAAKRSHLRGAKPQWQPHAQAAFGQYTFAIYNETESVAQRERERERERVCVCEGGGGGDCMALSLSLYLCV